MSSVLFQPYRVALLSRSLSNVWRGYGSAIFLEFGPLSPTSKSDGSPGQSQGEYTLMIEWSWRIEGPRSILCGSWSDEQEWIDVFDSLIGRKVTDVALYGRLSEVTLALEGERFITSFMTAEGQPAWTIFQRSGNGRSPTSISVIDGHVEESAE
ncbi:hypothetical protein O8B93_26715 [Agrobacterium rhizogenes]|uniref:hypothetical protein n=1 Tax=Rhizobium rhizogenes TaxID=359 RepID=UPI0022B64288|nr:hypothetical protein [Rhizobium rhizogenes]MCZ7451161.1 hypothetical protein [Rhizobium rhizogenes]